MDKNLGPRQLLKGTEGQVPRPSWEISPTIQGMRERNRVLGDTVGL